MCDESRAQRHAVYIFHHRKRLAKRGRDVLSAAAKLGKKSSVCVHVLLAEIHTRTNNKANLRLRPPSMRHRTKASYSPGESGRSGGLKTLETMQSQKLCSAEINDLLGFSHGVKILTQQQKRTGPFFDTLHLGVMSSLTPMRKIMMRASKILTPPCLEVWKTPILLDTVGGGIWGRGSRTLT